MTQLRKLNSIAKMMIDLDSEDRNYIYDILEKKLKCRIEISEKR